MVKYLTLFVKKIIFGPFSFEIICLDSKLYFSFILVIELER
jgi:hypothetical protein